MPRNARPDHDSGEEPMPRPAGQDGGWPAGSSIRARPAVTSHRPGPASVGTLGLVVVVILTVALWTSPPAVPVAAQSPDRLVLAFYYNWFDENSWSPARLPDLPAAPYVSRDRAVMGRQIDQARSAGIDAFVVNWYGPHVENNQTETNLRAMLDEAGARGFRLAVDLDLNSPFIGGAGDLQTALSALLNTHAQHGAYLRSGGKPVIFFYHPLARFGLGTWESVRRAVDPNHNSLWIEEGVDVSPLSVFDGHHLYSVTWANRTDMSYTANKFARLVRAQAAALGTAKVYVATVMPGYNDLRTGRGAAFAVDREGGAYYERSWQAAIGAAPDWIVINSFNEWPEGTYIEPSQAYGDRYLQITGAWAATFHNSSPPPASLVVASPAPTATGAAQAGGAVAAGVQAAGQAPNVPPPAAPARATALPPAPVPTPEPRHRLGQNGLWAL
jgi:hypothetical protein